MIPARSNQACVASSIHCATAASTATGQLSITGWSYRWSAAIRSAKALASAIVVLKIAVTSSAVSTTSRQRKIEAQGGAILTQAARSEEHTSELQSLMRISYAVFCLKKNTNNVT